MDTRWRKPDCSQKAADVAGGAVSIGGGWWHQPMPAPHINPPVMIVSPIRKSAVSNRVIVQSCRIVRLNCWTANEQDGPELLTDGFNEALSSHVAAQVPLPGTRPKRKRPYQAGRSKHWVKVKNRAHPAMYRVMDALAYGRGTHKWSDPEFAGMHVYGLLNRH